MVLMAAMGAGTVRALAILGLTGQVVTLGLKRWGTTAAAVVLVLAGLATALRGTETFHHLLGCPSAPAAETPACCSPSEGQ